MRAGVAIPVGPGPIELVRLEDVLASLDAHVPELDTIVLIDDGDEPRHLAELAGLDESRVVVLRPPRAPGHAHRDDRMAAGTLTLLRWLADSDRVDYLVQLDTDALAIGDFRPSVEAAIERRPDVAMWGAHRKNVEGGEPRDFSVFRLPLLLAQLPVRVRTGVNGTSRRLALEQAIVGRPALGRKFVRSAVAAARAHGYETGEHCLGGAYAITAAAARKLRDQGWLDDPLATNGTRLADDVVLGLLVRAAGLELGSLVGPGEAFAIKFQGLLAEPEELIARGHAIVHSVKNHDGCCEADLRSRFRRARTPSSTAV
jgi:hypothetical protein